MKNNKGFSLLELIIALFILAFSLLGFLGVMVNAIDSNLQNDLRNTGIGLTTRMAETLLSQDFDDLVENPTPAEPPYSCSLTPYDGTNACLVPDETHYPDPSNIIVRGVPRTYAITWSITDIGTSGNINLKEIKINVTYSYRGENFNNDTVIYKHRNL